MTHHPDKYISTYDGSNVLSLSPENISFVIEPIGQILVVVCIYQTHNKPCRIKASCI
jgi:hypothetical protein